MLASLGHVYHVCRSVVLDTLSFGADNGLLSLSVSLSVCVCAHARACCVAQGDPVEYRVKEAGARPEVAAATRSIIESVKAEAASTDEKYDHIEQDEKDKVLQECQRVATVLEEKLAAIEQQVRHPTQHALHYVIPPPLHTPPP